MAIDINEILNGANKELDTTEAVKKADASVEVAPTPAEAQNEIADLFKDFTEETFKSGGMEFIEIPVGTYEAKPIEMYFKTNEKGIDKLGIKLEIVNGEYAGENTWISGAIAKKDGGINKATFRNFVEVLNTSVEDVNFEKALDIFKKEYTSFKNNEEEKVVILDTFKGFGDLIVEPNNWTASDGTLVEATRSSFRK